MSAKTNEKSAPADSDASEADSAKARIDALTEYLKSADKSEAIAAYVHAHYAGNTVAMLRTLLRSVDYDTRNRALFTRKVSADGATYTYDLCGYVATIRKDASNNYRCTDEFVIHFRDKSGNEGKQNYGAQSSAYPTLKKAEANMLACWRNGVLKILDERDTERAKASSVDSATLAAIEAEVNTLKAENARLKAEADAKAHADAKAKEETFNATIASLMESMSAMQAKLDADTNAKAKAS